MKPISFSMIVTILFLFLSGSSFSQETKSPECMFKSSLHYTVRGMSYWYDKENGGLEKITGVSYESLACQNCHVASCDMCHKTEIDGKAVYSSEVAKNQDMCLKCHARETAIMKINQKENTEDVHFAAGMKCMDCHTTREMHGDGVKYTSMKQEGVMDVTCEKCHDNINKTTSHTIHGNKLDCKSCHVGQVVSCTNCHFETMVKEGKRVAVPVSGWEFLMNYGGKVTSANMQTFVVAGEKTFMIFAPQYSHSVTKNGKKCEECHANTNVKKVEEGTIDLTWLKDGKMGNLKGVIPVVDGVEYNSVFENFENGSWTPISNPEYPMIQYVGFGTPLTKEQLSKILIPQNSSDNK